MAKEDDKLYFEAGMVVTLKQDIPYKPLMIVQGKHTTMFGDPNNKQGQLKGITCIWFSTTGELQKETFNTKDLILIK